MAAQVIDELFALHFLSFEQTAERVGAFSDQFAQCIGVFEMFMVNWGEAVVDGEHTAVAAWPPPMAVDPNALLMDGVGHEYNGVFA